MFSSAQQGEELRRRGEERLQGISVLGWLAGWQLGLEAATLHISLLREKEDRGKHNHSGSPQLSPEAQSVLRCAPAVEAGLCYQFFQCPFSD